MENKTFHSPEHAKNEFAESKADLFRSMMGENSDFNTRVFSVELIGIEPARSELKCREFIAIGPQQFDKYYCGCKGWD